MNVVAEQVADHLLDGYFSWEHGHHHLLNLRGRWHANGSVTVRILADTPAYVLARQGGVWYDQWGSLWLHHYGPR